MGVKVTLPAWGKKLRVGVLPQGQRCQAGGIWFHKGKCMLHSFLQAAVVISRQGPGAFGCGQGKSASQCQASGLSCCHGNSLAYLQGSSGQSLRQVLHLASCWQMLGGS